MRTAIVWSIGLLLLLAGAAPVTAAGPEVTTEEQKTFYALGLALGQNLAAFTLSPAELELVKVGLSDAVLQHERKVDLQMYAPKVQELQRARMATVATAEKKSAQAFLDKAAAEKGATRTTSGLIISRVTPGSGPSPKGTDSVRVHYHGTLADGTVFDSSRDRGQPAVFSLNGVIPCFSEGLQLMKVGGKSRLVCPSDLAYGDRGAPPRIKPGAALVFDLELLEIVK
jgi:FKBP-type peptidyl-prolyl cis-trans isomerase FkpA/FKBP-type peptidyl-prolyl cis-trans isomerase FklB